MNTNTIIDAAKRLNPEVSEVVSSWNRQIITAYQEGMLKYETYLFKTAKGEEVEFSDYELGIVEYPIIEWAKNTGPRDFRQHALNEKVVAVIESSIEGAATQIIINDPCWDDDFEAIMGTEVHVETFDGEYVFSLAELTINFREQFPNFKMGEPPTVYVRIVGGFVGNIFVNDQSLASMKVVVIDEDVRTEDEPYSVTDYVPDGVVTGLDDIIEIL